MSGLEGRLKNLEAASSGDECPVCGLKPGDPVGDYEVVWEDIYTEDLADETNKEPERCDGCGRQLEYVVVWDDVDLAIYREEQRRGDQPGDESKAARGRGWR